MAHFIAKSAHPSRAEKILGARFVKSLDELAERLKLPRKETVEAKEAAQNFPLLIPDSLFDRIAQGEIEDPVLAQFLPNPKELERAPGFVCDPLEEWSGDGRSESSTRADSCVLKKYEGRALVLTTNSCAARCRFCFRRYFPKNRSLFPISKDGSYAERFDRAFESIRRDPTISELIFSGGDPLTLSNADLKALLHYIKTIGSVKRARFHSRVPILTPDRIDDDFPGFDDFNARDDSSPLVLHLALHVNSPNEINDRAARAVLRLRRKGFVLTSQTVLLKGVNDRLETLVELYEKLVNLGVVPYYLFQLDRVQGAAHWETPTDVGRDLVRRLAEKLPGYAVPKFAREIPGRPMKTNLSIETSVD